MLIVEDDFSLAAATEFWPRETHPHSTRLGGHRDRHSMQPEHQDGTGTGMAHGWTTGTGMAHGTRHMAHGMQTVLGHARRCSVLVSQHWSPCGAMPRADGRTTHQPQGPEDVALPGLPRPSRAERSRERKEKEEAKAAVGRGPAPGSREGTKAKRG